MSHTGKLEATKDPQSPGSQPLSPQEFLNQRLYPRPSLVNPFSAKHWKAPCATGSPQGRAKLGWGVSPPGLLPHWLCVHRAFFIRNADAARFPSCFSCSEQTSSPLLGNRNYTVSLCPVVLSAGFQHSPLPTETSTWIPCRDVVQ